MCARGLLAARVCSGRISCVFYNFSSKLVAVDAESVRVARLFLRVVQVQAPLLQSYGREKAAIFAQLTHVQHLTELALVAGGSGGSNFSLTQHPCLLGSAKDSGCLQRCIAALGWCSWPCAQKMHSCRAAVVLSQLCCLSLWTQCCRRLDITVPRLG